MKKELFERRSNQFFLIVFITCSILVFAGACNNGSFGYFSAIPFFICLLVLLKHDFEFFIFPFIFVIFISSLFYYLKIIDSRLFLSGVGKTIVTIKPVCINKSDSEARYSTLTHLYLCNEKNNDKYTFIPRGVEFEIYEVNVSNGDFGESYSYHARNDDIEFFEYEFNGNFKLKNSNNTFDINDIRNPILYGISWLMVWPMLLGGVFALPLFPVIPFVLYKFSEAAMEEEAQGEI
ncbi:hypothetical protein [Halobacteriovorax sp. YZS-1-1]|uniref:hypothetical protein n=1 Tax=unclassified Halobacteriovorax TaxID=2639665 RepID=UPI00399C075A